VAERCSVCVLLFGATGCQKLTGRIRNAGPDWPSNSAIEPDGRKRASLAAIPRRFVLGVGSSRTLGVRVKSRKVLLGAISLVSTAFAGSAVDDLLSHNPVSEPKEPSHKATSGTSYFRFVIPRAVRAAWCAFFTIAQRALDKL